MRALLSVLLTAILLVSPALAEQSQGEGPPKNVILFGWDGAQRAHVMECLQRGELFHA